MKAEWVNGNLDVTAFAENSYARRMAVDPTCDPDYAWDAAIRYAEDYRQFIACENARAFSQMRFDESEYQVALLITAMKANT